MIDLSFMHVETPFLEELADDLAGTFRVIAYSGYANDINYIKNIQKYFSKKYGKFLEHIETEFGELHVEPAYQTLQNLLENHPSTEEIISVCESCLEEHLMEPDFEDFFDSSFGEFYNLEHPD